MRKIKRVRLSTRSANALLSKQTVINQKKQQADFIANAEWDGFRNNRIIQEVYNTLKKMVGKRERCMYCEDSHGSDIEHFWPKTPYPEKMFLWENHLLCCTGCGRIKGKQFPLDSQNQPLLVNPTTEDPWESLDFDPGTGNIVPRYILETNAYSSKGTSTVTILKLDRREALSEGYRRSFHRICAVLEPYISASAQTPDVKHLVKLLKNADEHGLLDWCFRYSGKTMSPFFEFIKKHSAVADTISCLVPARLEKTREKKKRY